ncbi:trypsin-like serine peptidase [Halobacteriovorax sp. GFR7]|uniref:trypsin-like serine peptidase n=1 Tax=unclassified Halobacteriovorax TaxID=2639665 RepID=UPI003D95F513
MNRLRFLLSLTTLFISLNASAYFSPTLGQVSEFINNLDKAIYGELDIVDIASGTLVHNPAAKVNSHSSAIMVNRWSLEEVIDGRLFSVTGVDFKKTARLCEGEEKFLDQKAYGKCSAVLVGPKQVLTAAHCIQNAQLACERKSFIFDARSDLGSDGETQYFVNSQVYNCKNILAYHQSRDKTFDYALIELDRPVEGGRKPVEIQQEELKVSDEVYMIGHPNGFLSKYSYNGFVRDIDPLFYITNLDAFGGNSGGPVYSKESNKMVGLLIRGHDDFEWDTELSCNRVVHCQDDKCDGEYVLKISAIIDDIEKARDN